MRVLFLLFFLLPISTTRAEDQTDPKLQPNVVYKKHTKIDFGDAIVEGQVSNPEGIYLVTPPEKKFGSLLKLRKNFHRELIRDSLLMK